NADPQNYLVCPPQLWLDGINNGAGSIRQFVAVPLGLGLSVEQALTGAETHGGIQITLFEPKPGRFPDQPPPPKAGPGRLASPRFGPAMGIGAGGLMRQKIYADPHGIDTWDSDNCASVELHIVNSEQFEQITGKRPPPTPIDAQTYTKYGLPWFELYDEQLAAVAGSKRLAEVKSLAAHARERGEAGAGEDSFEVPESQIERLDNEQSRVVNGPSAPSDER
ncbi:MAG: hypothetical protein H7144_02555, partial [Burkholderiales bacterium]|nr:hypothetical protein [Phycisphaerae bacterium]